MKKHREQAYAQRFSQVLDFIDRHLDETLSVERLSRVAHFSKFHFHRQFSNYVGITPNRYVQLARLRRASYRLAFNPLERITDIAMEGGFARSESFSRVRSANRPAPSEKTPTGLVGARSFNLFHQERSKPCKSGS
jgi:AraC family transcriptional regulator